MSIATDAAGVFSPSRLNMVAAGNLAAVNAELLIDTTGTTIDTVNTKGGGEAIAILDLRWTFSATINVEASVDGVNFIPLFSRNAIVNITTAGVYRFNCAGYKEVRARVTAYTSGTAAAVLQISLGSMSDRGTTAVSTGLGTANTATTLTIAAVPNMRHYINRIEIWRVNGTATAVTASALLAITSTNLPTNYGWNVANGIAAWAHEKLVDATFDSPLVSTTMNTATTIVMPAAGAGVQWRCNVHYFLGE